MLIGINNGLSRSTQQQGEGEEKGQQQGRRYGNIGQALLFAFLNSIFLVLLRFGFFSFSYRAIIK